MSFHTKEAQLIKKKAIAKILGRMYENLELKKAGKKISSSHEPKMYLRMARLLAGTDDSVFIDEVENLLAKDADGDKLKNKLRGISERNIPLRRKRVLSDRLHHGIPLELMDSLMKQDPDVMLEFLQAAEADGRYFGDSASNIDNSFQEQSHTGAKDKATSKFRNYPYELGIEGDRQFSAHPHGTAKGSDKSLNQKFNNGTEMYQAFLPAIEEAEFELKLGINSDTSRRVVANNLLVEEGLLLPGEDNWSTSMPEERIKANREFLAKPEPGMQVAAAQNPYKYQDPADLNKAGITQAQIENWDVENQVKLLKKNGGIRLNRRLATAAAAGGILALGPLGTVASAAEVKERTSIAEKTDNFVDKTQAAIAGTSFAADLMTYNPVTAIPATLVSTSADALNLVIDGGRAFLSGNATRNRRKLEREEQLRALPADAAERENALSVGFAGGM